MSRAAAFFTAAAAGASIASLCFCWTVGFLRNKKTPSPSHNLPSGASLPAASKVVLSFAEEPAPEPTSLPVEDIIDESNLLAGSHHRGTGNFVFISNPHSISRSRNLLQLESGGFKMPQSKAVLKQSAQKRRRQLILGFSDSEDDDQNSVPGGLDKDSEGTQFRKRVFGNPNLTVISGINQSRVSDQTNIREAVKSGRKGPVKRAVTGGSLNKSLETRVVIEKSQVGSKRPAQPGMQPRKVQGANNMGGEVKKWRLILSYDSEEDEPLAVPVDQKKETGLATVTSEVSSVEAIEVKNKVAERRVLNRFLGDGNENQITKDRTKRGFRPDQPREEVGADSKRCKFDDNLPFERQRVAASKCHIIQTEGQSNMDNGTNFGKDSVFARKRGREVLDVRAAKHLPVSGFGKDNYGIGSWEKKALVSRDGQMRLSGDILMASIDQRSVSGESACAALVAVIADFLHTNPGRMPTMSQFDCLIREGSLEWRKLCQNKTYIERFPNRHFDLDTILEAKIRPMSIVSEESHFGFFRPKPTIDNSQLEFLEAFKSFDEMWDDIRRAATECNTDGVPLLYIVSWNDHFFVLKVEPNAYYLIDTLGERLQEGCKQGYILRFDESTMIHKIRGNGKASETEMTKHGSHQVSQKVNHAKEEFLVSGGKESCKEYIKSFLAAIPIRDLEADIKRGPVASELLHRRLQIELHYTKALKIREQL